MAVIFLAFRVAVVIPITGLRKKEYCNECHCRILLEPVAVFFRLRIQSPYNLLHFCGVEAAGLQADTVNGRFDL